MNLLEPFTAHVTGIRLLAHPQSLHFLRKIVNSFAEAIESHLGDMTRRRLMDAPFPKAAIQRHP
jgi:hypothetical protein